MTTMLLALSAATLSFSGDVPPHLANDGHVYELRGQERSGIVEAAFRRCKVKDFRLMSANGDEQAYRFAIAASDMPNVRCLLAALPKGGIQSASWED